MIFAELPPVVYIHALLFEFFFLIPYASALAAEPSHLTKINKNNVVLHITPMICSPTQAFVFPYFECVFISLQSGLFILCNIHFQRDVEGLGGRVLPHQELPGSKCEGRRDTGAAAVRLLPGSPNLPPLPGSCEVSFIGPVQVPRWDSGHWEKLLQPCLRPLCFLYKLVSP